MFTMWLLICKSKSEIFMTGRLLASPLRLRWLPREAWAQQGFRHLASRSGFHDLDDDDFTGNIKQIVQLYVAGDRNLCWVWDSPRLGLPRPSCRCPLHHLLQMQVFKLLSSSFSARNICSPSVLPSQFSVKVQNLICCDTECLLQKWFLPKDWKLVELGKALLILPLTWVFRKLDLCSGGIAGFRGSAGAR